MPIKAFRHIVLLIFFFCGLFSHLAYPQSAKKYWVYFVDKGPSYPRIGTLSKVSAAYQKVLEYVQPRALARRAKVLPREDLLDVCDLPLYKPYLDEIQNLGIVLAQQSRWLNAASFFLTTEQAIAVKQLSFVVQIEPVVIFKGRPIKESVKLSSHSFRKYTSLDYGSSFAQVHMINVPTLHDAGITGRGVLIGMLDSGFRWRAHEVLQTRHVIAEHDFIFNDNNTANEAGDRYDQDSHGTLTFSVVGGYMPGKLIGPAFDADFILGKTEYIPTETRVEEDNWAAAIEWMEGYGVDVVSSSVGYDQFDSPDSGYTWAHGDFNGRTSITAKAAVRAARLGVVVCNSMGNERNGDGIVGTLITPADADSIISVGAVTFARHLAFFSSTGPTNDGRTKPDVVAPGVSVYHATVPGPDTYGYSQGTSLSTPLTAGAAALLLSARPELTPIQVLDALRSTADTIDILAYPTRPNNFTGWGLVNAYKAALSFGPIFSNKPTASVVAKQSVLSTTVISKFGILPDSVFLYYSVDGSGILFTRLIMALDSSMLFPTSGKYKVTIPQQALGTPVHFYIEAHDSAFNQYRNPAQITGQIWLLNYGDTSVRYPSTIPKAYSLKQNYPNPFNSSTRIEYDLPRKEHVTVKVYNLLGQLIATLVDEIQDMGDARSRPAIIFDATNSPSGVYFYRISTPSFVATKKMMLIR